jgi:hypothetical protein
MLLNDFRDYAAITFIANNRFETGKKKLLHLRFRDFAVCATHMITSWSYSSVGKVINTLLSLYVSDYCIYLGKYWRLFIGEMSERMFR